MLAVISPISAYRYFAQPIRPTGTRAEMVQHPRQHRIAIALAAGLLASLLIAPVPAQSQPTQYITTVWQTEQGLPQNSVNAMLQDHRGYLWIGTFGGLARFDGERFRVFDSGDTPGFGNNPNPLLCTKVAPEYCGSVLWTAVSSGWKTALPPHTPSATACRAGSSNPSAEMPKGTCGSKPRGRRSTVCRRQAGGLPHSPGKAVREFYLQARDGSMWFRCGKDLVRFGADGSIATLKVRKPSVFLVQEARDGSVWIAVRDEYRLVRYYQGAFSDVPLPPIGPARIDERVSRICTSPWRRTRMGNCCCSRRPDSFGLWTGGSVLPKRYRCLRMAANCPRCAACW